jgi:hypothetical protein
MCGYNEDRRDSCPPKNDQDPNSEKGEQATPILFA